MLFFLFAHKINTKVEITEAAKKCGIVVPSFDADSRIETLNNKGAMAPGMDPISKKFMNQALKKKCSVLEIGPAYGNTAMAVLRNPKFTGDYTVLDLSAQHIQIIQERYKIYSGRKNTLHSFIASFPEFFIQKNTFHYDAILMVHVLHFYTPEEVKTAIQTIFNLLTKGGRAYIVAKTPYSTRYQSFIPIFEARKKEGNLLPGFIDNVAEFANPTVTPAEKLKNLEGCKLQLFDREVLEKLFKSAGFKIIECREFPLDYKSKVWTAPLGYEGREDVGIIVEKP